MPHADVSQTYPGMIDIWTEYADRILIKNVPGARWKDETRTWAAPLTWVTCKTLRAEFGTKLTIGAQLNQWGREQVQNRIKPALGYRPLLEIPDEDQSEAANIIRSWRGQPLELRPFQEVDVLFMHAAGSSLLEQPMGSGKTCSTVGLVRLHEALGLNPFPILVVAPASVKAGWERTFKDWMPHVSTRVISGSAGQRQKQLQTPADVTIVNWESIRLHSSLAPYGPHSRTDAEKEPKELDTVKWGFVIADEIHRAKDPRSKQTRALWASSRDAIHRIGLSGTPIANHIGDLWALLNFLEPTEWPSSTAYFTRWVEQEFNIWGGRIVHGLNAANKDEFFELTDPRTRRIPKEVILPNLPPKVYQTRTVEMAPKQRRAYNSMVDSLLAELDSGDLLIAPNPLVRTMRMMQFSSAFCALDDDRNVIMSDPSCKVDEMVLLLEELEGEKVVVFAQSKELINLTARRLEKLVIEYARITGDETETMREVNRQNFQDPTSNVQVMLATTGAGGVGIDLTVAPVLVRLQRDWRELNNQQAEDRIHRIGSEHHSHVRIIDIVTDNSIELRQLDMLAGKYGNMQEVVRDADFMRFLITGKK